MSDIVSAFDLSFLLSHVSNSTEIYISTQASGEDSWGTRTLGDSEFSIDEASGTLAKSWGMEGEAKSSDCFIVGLGRVGKSQGRGTYRFQIVSRAIYPELASLPKLQA